MKPPVGSGALRSNTPMLSRPRKPPWKTLRPCASLRFTHQVKFSSSLWKTRSRKARSPLVAALLAVDLEHPPGRPGVDRRVDVGERPLVGRQLAVRVHVPLAGQHHELLLGELGVDQRERDAVEGEVPGGVPGILPFVRHRDDVVVVEVAPVAVAAVAMRPRAAAAGSGRPRASAARRSGRTACSRSCRRTPGAGRGARPGRRVRPAARRRTRRLRRGAARAPRRSSANGWASTLRARRRRKRGAALGRDLELVVRGRLGAVMRRVHGVPPAGDQILVERVLEVALGALDAEQPPGVGVVVAEQERRARRRHRGA